jgi:hypothetical protein
MQVVQTMKHASAKIQVVQTIKHANLQGRVLSHVERWADKIIRNICQIQRA